MQEVSHVDLINALSKRIGMMVVDYENLRMIVDNQVERIKDLETALAQMTNAILEKNND